MLLFHLYSGDHEGYVEPWGSCMFVAVVVAAVVYGYKSVGLSCRVTFLRIQRARLIQFDNEQTEHKNGKPTKQQIKSTAKCLFKRYNLNVHVLHAHLYRYHIYDHILYIVLPYSCPPFTTRCLSYTPPNQKKNGSLQVAGRFRNHLQFHLAIPQLQGTVRGTPHE